MGICSEFTAVPGIEPHSVLFCLPGMKQVPSKDLVSGSAVPFLVLWLEREDVVFLLLLSFCFLLFCLSLLLGICSDQFSSVAQSCLTLCDLMNCRTLGLPVHHQLPEFTQTHVHRVGDAIQPSHPLLSPSPPAPNPSQHQSLF